MSVTATDVVGHEEVRAILEERTQPMYQFRRAFRDHDATTLDGGTYVFPSAENTLRGEMGTVEEDTDYPRSELRHEGITAEYSKDGFEVAITDEAVDDTPVDVILDITQEMAISAEHRLDSLAYNALAANRNETVIENDGTLAYEDLVDAYELLVDDMFNPADFEIYLSPGSWGSLAKDEHFTHASDAGDSTIRQGVIDPVLGVPVFLTNTGDLGPNEAAVVDTGMYGYESTRWDREVETYREQEADRDVYKIRHRKDFVTMKSDAAVFIEEAADTTE